MLASESLTLGPEGGEKGLQAERQRTWASCIAAIQQRHCHSATWLADRTGALQAIAASLVDCRFKSASGGAGQALMSLEHSLRHVARHKQQMLTAVERESSICCTVLDRPVHCFVLPSWPALQVNSPGSAMAELLFFLQQRLYLAHTGEFINCWCMYMSACCSHMWHVLKSMPRLQVNHGAHLARVFVHVNAEDTCANHIHEFDHPDCDVGSQLLAHHSASDVAQLYFFVNRTETDKWILRTCELRARVACDSASQHVALHAASAWLLQLLSATRHFIATLAKKAPDMEEAAAKAHQVAHSVDLVSGGIEAVAPKPIKILRPQHPPEASKPRSVVKVQYQRKQECSEQNLPNNAPASPAVPVPQETPKPSPESDEGVAATKHPRRLLLSALQLAYLLCSVLEELRENKELRRLHVVLSTALEPVMKRLLELDCQAQVQEAQENHPLPSSIAGSRHTTATDLLAFVLGSAMRVEGCYEEAVLQFHTALTAGLVSPATPPEHTTFCMHQVAQCYASLNDWKRLGEGWQGHGVCVSAGFQIHSKIQGLEVWQPAARTDDTSDEILGRLRTSSKPLNVPAILDEPIMKAHASVSALFPAPPRSGQPQNIDTIVCQLGHAFDRVLQDMSCAVAPFSANMAAEFVSLMHAGAAMTQLLIARLPPGAAMPDLPQWLCEATAAEDPCQHLLAASSILTVDIQGSETVVACDSLQRRSCALSEPLQAAFSGVHQATLDAVQLPLHALIFSVACKLASAQEYSVYGAAGTNMKLPTKEAALQVFPLCSAHYDVAVVQIPIY